MFLKIVITWSFQKKNMAIPVYILALGIGINIDSKDL